MEGIQQMFSDISGNDEYQLELFTWALRQRAAARQWKRDNAEAARRHARESMARRYAADAEYRERKKAAARAQYQQRRMDPAFRETMRQNAKRQHERRAA